MSYRLLITEQAPSSGQGRGRPRKHGLPSRTHAQPTTSTAPMSTTPTTTATSAPPGHSPYI